MWTLRTATPRRAAPVLAAAVVVLLGSGSAPAADAPDLGNGGFVVYVGHFGTGAGCAVDRRLTTLVRTQARGVPIGRVLAAPGCAARATARLAFGRAIVSRRLLARAGVSRALSATPRRGTNTVLHAEAPLANLFGYSSAMRSLSQGRASCSMEPSTYAPAPDDVLQKFLGES